MSEFRCERDSDWHPPQHKPFTHSQRPIGPTAGKPGSIRSAAQWPLSALPTAFEWQPRRYRACPTNESPAAEYAWCNNRYILFGPCDCLPIMLRVDKKVRFGNC